MARLNIPITALTQAGVVPGAIALGIAADDLELLPTLGDLCWLEIENIDTTARDVVIITTGFTQGFSLEDITVSVPASTFATLTTALTGTNNDLLFTSDIRGDAGNLISIVYVVAGLGTSLTVSVTGLAITVNVATDGGGAPTSTAAQVKTALEANASAAALLTIANAPGNDGTGVVTAMSATFLAGGLPGMKLVKFGNVSPYLQTTGKINVDVANSSVLRFRAFKY